MRFNVTSKNILIVDEQRFGKICSALVSLGGFGTEWASGCEEGFCKRDFETYSLVITSYPYGSQVLTKLAGKQVGLLVLSDFACEKLMQTVAENTNFHCLVKPVDFSRFNHVVSNLIAEKVI